MKEELIERGFPTNYEIELVSEITAADETQRLFYPGASRHGGGDGLTLAVSSLGDRWVGTFAFGGYDPGALTRVFTLPDPECLSIIAGGAGYIVRASDPQDWDLIDAFPIRDARLLKQENLFLVVDFTKVVAYGLEGYAWKTGRLSWDGVRIIASERGQLSARVWDAPNDRETTVAIDLQTGRHRGGAAPPQERTE